MTRAVTDDGKHRRPVIRGPPKPLFLFMCSRGQSCPAVGPDSTETWLRIKPDVVHFTSSATTSPTMAQEIPIGTGAPGARTLQRWQTCIPDKRLLLTTPIER